MKFSNKTRLISFVLLILLNVIIRFQVTPREIGIDSFFIHVITNSLSEYGYARWYLNPLSLAGLYPYSYSSSVPFMLSGLYQTTNIDMNQVIYLYCTLLGILSMLTGYMMAHTITDDDLYKTLVAFWFSTSLAVVGYSTWTIPTRGLLIFMAPLILYLLMKFISSDFKYMIPTIVFAIFLFTTHHLIYFLLPSFFISIILALMLKFRPNILALMFKLRLYPRISERYSATMIIAGFLFMFSIPFIAGKFIESSRYAPLITSYARYIGFPIIFAFGGLIYLIFKSRKNYSEWFILLSTMLLTMFIYKLTYMKDFIPIFAVPLAAFGFVNMTKALKENKYLVPIIIIVLLISSSFVSYYQFLHIYSSDRPIENSLYSTGVWMKSNVNGSSICNNDIIGLRISSVATKHFLQMSTTIDQIYGFISSNVSEYKRYPLKSEQFWYSGYDGPDYGNTLWGGVNLLNQMPQKYNISYVVEDVNANGDIIWSPHKPIESKLITEVRNKNGCIFDNGNLKIWHLGSY